MDAPGVFSPGTRVLSIGIALGVSVVGFEALGVSTAMPVASRVLHGESLYGWAFSAFLLGQLIGIVVAGTDADARGPRRAYLAGLALFGAGLLVSGAAPSMVVLVVGRFLAGLGSGAVLLLNWALIGRCYSEPQRPRMLAVASSAWVVPGLVGPAIAGAVADHASWRLVFVGLVPVIALVGALLRPHLSLPPIEAPTRTRTHDPFWDASPRRRNAASVGIAAGTGLFLAGIVAHRLIVAAPLVIAGLLVVGRQSRTLFPAGMTRARTGLPAVVATYAALLSAFVGTEAFLPFVLDRVHHVSAFRAGLILSGGTIAWTLGSWIQARDPTRWTRRLPATAAMALFVIGIASTVALTWPSVSIAVGYASWTIGGIGMGVAFTAVSDLTFRVTDEGRFGIASSATQLAGALGGALVAGVNGAIVAIVERQHRSVSALRIVFAVDVAVALLALFAGLKTWTA